MEYQLSNDTNFANTLENLIVMFENVVSKDVISDVLESCGGDLNLAADAIMDMTNDEAPSVVAESPPSVQQSAQPEAKLNVGQDTDQIKSIPLTQQSVIQNTESVTTQKPGMSYAGASQSTGAVPKQFPKSSPRPKKVKVWPDEIKDIIFYHNQGSRILILMRGAPGSGKSYLAREIVEMTVGATYTDYNTHILSTDDFFMARGKYQYDKSRLSHAHVWNQDRAAMALKSGLSPVIIDNTNIEFWEMEPYLKEGVRNGYIIKVVEPNTPWAKKTYQLIKKSTHNVPPNTIRRMLDNLQSGIKGEQLIKHFGLSYPGNMVPPVIRLIPPFNPPEVDTDSTNNTEESHSSVLESISGDKEKQTATVMGNENTDIKTDTIDKSSHLITTVFESENENEDIGNHERYMEIQKQLEEIEKVEVEWEHGESWDDEVPEKNAFTADGAVGPLPPRPHFEESTPRTNDSSTLLDDMVPKCEDWTQISIFMPPWNDTASNASSLPVDNALKVTKSSSTCIEIGDTDLKNRTKVLKVITATPRDINLMYIPLEREKIPEKRMLDKGTMTNEFLITEAYKCQNVEHHFVAFRKMFKNYSKASLRDIFDKCCGDVNWAVEIVMSDINTKQLKLKEDDYVSDDEVEIKGQCDCLAAYGIIPDTNSTLLTDTRSSKISTTQNTLLKSIESVKVSNKKSKNTPSESSLQLKREIERNFVLSDNNYSPHTLKLKKWRHGENLDENCEANVSTVEPNTSERCLNYDFVQSFGHTKDIATGLSDDEESNSSAEDVERTINVHLGAEFVHQLDELFGRSGMRYPENVVPRINIPISLLNEINAFWIESLMSQLDEQDKQNAKMLREDEEFARQLVMKENEMAQQGKTPAVPDFKEIMDMDFAISLYQKDMAEWRNKEPKDIAAKMSRDKLYNLFPSVPQDILSELLMAHDNDFLATVEGLLISTGRANVVEEQNGVNKYIMEKEMERQEKILEEERKALTEVEWPLLPKGKKVEMSTVNQYREEAEKHLARRNLNYEKAQDYIRRGMTQVANYYSDIASFHKKKYEQANSLAAASLMQVHADKCPDNATIDLHYLRVGEAKESLDLFLDTHIQKLRESASKGINSHHTLFFITGRGLHSNGRPKIKPAVKKRLKERGLLCMERNPGLLTSKVCAEDKLSYQVQMP